VVVFSMRVDGSLSVPVLAGIWSLLFAFWAASARRSDEKTPAKKAEGGRIASGGFVIVIALVASLFASAFAPSVPLWGSGLAWLRGVSAGGGGQGPAGVIGISGAIDVNGWLQAGNATSLLRVDGDYNGPLQVLTMTDFDGQTWQQTLLTDPVGQAVAPGEVLWPSGDNAWASVFPTTANTTIQFLSWNDFSIPLGVGPRTVQTYATDLQYSSYNDSLMSSAGLAMSGSGSVDESIGMIDRDTLPEDVATPSIDSPPDQLAVPQTSHTSDLEVLVAALTRGATDDYAKLMAIQDYLRSSSFSYTLTPNRTVTSDDAVWDFLQRRTGYCVQFATAMAMLGRLAGIPMRVAVGFTLPSSGQGVVTSQMAHVWPQAHFANAGWVSFEPTPGGGNAVPAPPVTATTPTPTPTPSTPTTSTSGPSKTTTTPSSTATVTPGGPGENMPWQWMLAGVAAALFVVLAVWGVRSWRASRMTPERAWLAIMKAAQARDLVDVAATPRAVIEAVNPRVDDATRANLQALADEIERRRYAPPGEAPPKTSPRQWHRTQAAVLRDLKGKHAA